MKIIISNNITEPHGTSGPGLQLVDENDKIKYNVVLKPNTPVPLKQRIAIAKYAFMDIFKSSRKIKIADQISILAWELYKKHLEK